MKKSAPAPETPGQFRIAYFDLETSSLKGDLGRLICGSMLLLPECKMVTYRNDELGEDMSDDKALAKAIRDCLATRHVVVGWNSKGFDIAFLNTRLAAHKLKLVSRHLHLDPMYSARGWRGIKPRNSRLDTVAEFFDLPERKQKVDVQVWVRAQAGNKEAIDILCERCESDVRVLAGITEAMLDTGIVKRIESYP